jgi:hypothetical protein
VQSKIFLPKKQEVDGLYHIWIFTFLVYDAQMRLLFDENNGQGFSFFA